MRDRDLFEKFCKDNNLGPREDIENHPDVPAVTAYAHTRIIAEELIASARTFNPSLPPIYFDFESRGQVNAWATRVDDRYLIGLTSGAMAMLHLVANRMLANPNAFPHIGHPGAEDPDVPQVDWSVVDAARHFDLGVRPVLPRDEKRRRYSQHLADQALLFVVGHEIAHISRGHIDFLLSTTNSPLISELGFSGTAKSRLERQAIETDADARSVVSRCHTGMALS